ncbi:MAG: ATP-NAD kinase [Gammaproteobacteria bacterium]|nr:MAG: ATP-NAD kinase [Gammaproteobacteria bacterium]
MFRLGLIINPLAGIGGRVALKGSDGEAIVKQAQQLGAQPLAQSRVRSTLEEILGYKAQIKIYTAAHDMGEFVARDMGFDVDVIADNIAGATTADDTENTVNQLLQKGIDLLLFAGGDGTARNIYHALHLLQQDHKLPVIGIPAGCKIHSSVYAVTPRHAGELLALIIRGRPLALQEAQVMDIDEEAFRHDVVKARRYGQLMVPAENQYMQSMKEGGVTQEALVLQDIAAYVVEIMEDDTMYFIGSGTTPKAIMDELGLESTLLGIDAVYNKQLYARDLNEQQIRALLQEHPRARLVLTIIGGQGHLFGRGNQQLSPEVIRAIGKDNMMVIATPDKLHALDGRPIRVDTGDEALNESLCGMIPVITGYEQQTLYRIAH